MRSTPSSISKHGLHSPLGQPPLSHSLSSMNSDIDPSMYVDMFSTLIHLSGRYLPFRLTRFVIQAWIRTCLLLFFLMHAVIHWSHHYSFTHPVRQLWILQSEENTDSQTNFEFDVISHRCLIKIWRILILRGQHAQTRSTIISNPAPNEIHSNLW